MKEQADPASGRMPLPAAARAHAPAAAQAARYGGADAAPGTGLRVAVVGAGWAGLAAAAQLHEAGCAVTVHDAGRVPGGRARRVERDVGPALDNGQHILLGAYGQTLALMRRLGCDPQHLFLRTRLRLESADGSFRLAAPALPAPLHAAWALAAARGLSLSERLAALRLMRALRAAAWSVPPDWTVAQLLQRHGQPPRLCARLWTPLCLAALNTAPHEACATLFATVLRDSLAGARQASDILLPRTDLSALWPDAAAALGDWRPGHAVRELRASQGQVEVDGQAYDAAVLAVPPPAAAALLAGLPARPGADELRDALRAFRYLPIATVTLELAGPWRLPRPMMMLFEDPARGHAGQWVFDRAALAGRPESGELAVVVSAAHGLPGREAAAALLAEQVREQAARHPGRLPPMPAVAASACIVEKRATFAAVPGLCRPAQETPWPRIALAGDWTDTGYPGVLEGAVRSGLAAARVLLRTLRAP